MLISYKQQSYFSQIVSKKARITILFLMKNSKNNNIILGFSFMFLVSVYLTNRTKENKKQPLS
jgi:predicted type IV restriction endonuclease